MPTPKSNHTPETFLSMTSVECCEITGKAKEYGPRGTYWINMACVNLLVPIGTGYEMYVTYGSYYKRFFVEKSEWKRIAGTFAR